MVGHHLHYGDAGRGLGTTVPDDVSQREGLATVLGAGQLQLTDLDLGDNQLGPEFGNIVAGVIQAGTSLRTVK